MDGWAKSRLRLIAAGCMIGAMGAPVALLFWYLNASNPAYPGISTASLATTYMLPAIVGVAISGYILGWRLVNPAAYHEGWLAAVMGVRIWLLACAVMCVILMLMWLAQPHLMIWYDSPAGTVRDIRTIVSGSLLTVLLWIALTGWITLPAACVASYFLSSHYCKKRPPKSALSS